VEKAFLNNQTKTNTQDISTKIKNQDKEYCNGMMVENTKVK